MCKWLFMSFAIWQDNAATNALMSSEYRHGIALISPSAFITEFACVVIYLSPSGLDDVILVGLERFHIGVFPTFAQKVVRVLPSCLFFFFCYAYEHGTKY
tara:strand:+ start:275 stop:574 length:300 start_codon:yes stop_codon:yes gene_type:complete